MGSYFAPAERASKEKIFDEVNFVSTNPLMSGLLNSVSGLLAVLDEHRQIIALNESFLQLIGIDEPETALGLRPGEVLNCIHAHKEPGGCGTAHSCATCGAAIAIMSSIEQDGPVEKICALAAKKKGQDIDMVLIVRSQPIWVEGQRFLLLFLQDITRQQQQAALERTFFHDISNMMQMLVGASELLIEECSSDVAETVQQVALRLHKEIAMQRCLAKEKTGIYQPFWHEYTVAQILGELKKTVVNHPAARTKTIEYTEACQQITVNTDISLLQRILGNMVINALEATPENGTVKIWLESKGDYLSFCVWNDQEIPRIATERIFQRNFSTKDQAGRGIGTYSMKLFGEKILGGRVSFTTSKENGTVFTFSTPV